MLRRAMTTEFAVGVAVIALTAGLVVSPPAIASAAGFAILSRFGRFIPSASQRSISTKSSSISVSDGTFLSTRPCA